MRSIKSIQPSYFSAAMTVKIALEKRHRTAEQSCSVKFPIRQERSIANNTAHTTASPCRPIFRTHSVQLRLAKSMAPNLKIATKYRLPLRLREKKTTLAFAKQDRFK